MTDFLLAWWWLCSLFLCSHSLEGMRAYPFMLGSCHSVEGLRAYLLMTFGRWFLVFFVPLTGVAGVLFFLSAWFFPRGSSGEVLMRPGVFYPALIAATLPLDFLVLLHCLGRSACLPINALGSLVVVLPF